MNGDLWRAVLGIAAIVVAGIAVAVAIIAALAPVGEAVRGMIGDWFGQ